MKFVVHEHHARRLHWDLRLEMDGVFKSWAVPKGPSMNPADKRLAVEVEDHDLTYGDFEGVIPEGTYGAGIVAIWDRGEYTVPGAHDPTAGLAEGKLDLVLDGDVLKGGFSLIRFKKASDETWLFIKKRDEQADDSWTLHSALSPEREREIRDRAERADGSEGSEGP